MASKLKVVIFLGTTREGRLGPRVAKFVQDHLKSKYDVTLFGERFYHGYCVCLVNHC